ncbi:class I SAM-dependent methyltransferase, partial [candidate division KSB1 bacterium]
AVCGVDSSSEAVLYGSRYAGGDNVLYLQMQAENLGFKRVFDIAVSFQVIEHIADIDRYINGIRMVVKHSGKIIISTPNVPRSSWEKSTNPFHVREFDYPDFRQLIENYFTSFELMGVVYAESSRIRAIVQRLPVYKWGKLLKRSSVVKKAAARSMKLTGFTVTDHELDKSMDLIAVCVNN